MEQVNRQRRVRVLFDAILELPISDRLDAVQRFCNDDCEMRSELLALLKNDECDDSRFEGPLLGTRVTPSRIERLHEVASPQSCDNPSGGSLRLAAIPLEKQLGRYELLEILGHGSMGVVYLAKQADSARLVALKTIRPERVSPHLQKRFQVEKRSLAQLQHPNIAQLYDAGVASTSVGDTPFIAMELVKGEPLLQFLRNAKPSLLEKLQLFVSLCDAVHHAHQRGVIHRDLKPGNILVSGGEEEPVATRVGTPKIVDFGVSQLNEPDSDTPEPTLPGEIVGTLGYMSPEQVLGRRVDTRCDIYALGAIFYELVAGAPPLDVSGLSVVTAAKVICEMSPPRLSALNREWAGDLAAIADKALQKNPDDRYESAAALGADVRRHLTHEPVIARPQNLRYLCRKFVRRHRMVVGFSLAILVAIVAGVFGTLFQALQAQRAATESRKLLDATLDNFVTMSTEVVPQLEQIAGSSNSRRIMLVELGQQLELLQQVGVRTPRLLEARAALLESLSAIERLEQKSSDALKHRQDALRDRTELAELRPNLPGPSRQLAISYVLVGDSMKELGQSDKARIEYESALSLQKKAQILDPGSVDLLVALCFSYGRLTELECQALRLESAAKYLDEAAAICARIERDHGERRDALEALQFIDGLKGWLSEELHHDREGSGAAIRNRLERLRKLLKLSPDNRTYITDLALAHLAEGSHCCLIEACQDAFSHNEQAAQIIDRLVDLEGIDVHTLELKVWQHLDRAMIHARNGDVRLARSERIVGFDAIRAYPEFRIPNDSLWRIVESHISNLYRWGNFPECLESCLDFEDLLDELDWTSPDAGYLRHAAERQDSWWPRLLCAQ